MSLTEWLDHVTENCVESATMAATRDPVDLLDEIEHNSIERTGYNLNGERA